MRLLTVAIFQLFFLTSFSQIGEKVEIVDKQNVRSVYTFKGHTGNSVIVENSKPIPFRKIKEIVFEQNYYDFNNAYELFKSRGVVVSFRTIITDEINCENDISSDEIDDFDGSRTIITKFLRHNNTYPKRSDYIDEENTLLYYLIYSKDSEGNEIFGISFIIMPPVELGCLSNYDGKAILLFEDDSRISMKQVSEVDCSSQTPRYLLYSPSQGTSARTYIEMEDNWEILKSKKIRKVRIYADKPATFDIKNGKSQEIQTLVNCLDEKR